MVPDEISDLFGKFANGFDRICDMLLFNIEAFESDINVLDECDHVVEDLAAGVDGLIFILVFPANDRACMNTVIRFITDRSELSRQRKQRLRNICTLIMVNHRYDVVG